MPASSLSHTISGSESQPESDNKSSLFESINIESDCHSSCSSDSRLDGHIGTKAEDRVFTELYKNAYEYDHPINLSDKVDKSLVIGLNQISSI